MTSSLGGLYIVGVASLLICATHSSSNGLLSRAAALQSGPVNSTGGSVNGTSGSIRRDNTYLYNQTAHGEAAEERVNEEEIHEEHQECELTVAGFEWHSVQNPIIIAAFLFFSAITKICFHHAGYLVTKIPESCLLIVLGTIAGTIFTFATDANTFPRELKTLKPDLFFMVLLPPIILEASYSLHNRVFFDNVGSILIFAVIGTIFSCFFIGPVLFGLSYVGALPGGDEISFIHCMLFASIIVAVDPVAVLAIFQEVGVNSVLYFLVFGESLLNDAVTVVLYHTVEGMNCYLEEGEEITSGMYITAVFKFFSTSLGGIVMGIIYGIITALLTKYTVEIRVVEPLLLFSLSYLSYVTSELFHFSGIVGITVCGLIQAQYAFHNISHKSYVTVKYFTKMASSAADSVIFLYLGLNLVRLDHEWHSGFIVAVILLTLISRFMITYSLSAVVNSFRLRQISKREQFIMAYGGLRGAVAFSLVSLLSGKLDQKIQSMFMTTILVIIIFTVFIQGGTIKPLVSLLDIATKDKDQKLILFNELNANVTDHLMAGIEEIVGTRGQFFFYDWFMNLDDKYIKHKLQRNPLRKDEKIMKIYEKIALKQHFANLRGAEIAETYNQRQALSIAEESLPPDSLPSLHPITKVSDPRAQGARPSLLSQLTRYGDINEPEQIDDIAYITPEMLEDEEMTAVEQRRLNRQQTLVTDELNHAHQLRQLLTKPGSSMDAREMRTKLDMDERSNLMYLLQEKNKRLERFKRSVSNVGNEMSLSQAANLAMTTIPERRQIVRRPTGVGRQSSDMRARSKRFTFQSNMSTNDNLQSHSLISGTGRVPKDTEKQRRLQHLHSMKSLKDSETIDVGEVLTEVRSDTGSIRHSLDLQPSAKTFDEPNVNNSNIRHSSNARQRNAGSEDDSVFLSRGDEFELKPLAEVDDVVEAIQRDSEVDVEMGQQMPLAHSSEESDTYQPLPTLLEQSEQDSSDLSLVRQAAVELEDEANPEAEPLVPRTDTQTSPHGDA